MSHYSVTVALAAEYADEVTEAVARLLAPFDENLDVEQRRDDDSGEIYWINPQAKWDWYQIGGRFSHHLPIRAAADPADLLNGERSWANADEDLDPTYTDAGRIRALDFERARAAAAEAAGPAWDEYAFVIFGTSQHEPWQRFVERVRAAEANAPHSRHDLEQEALARVRADFCLVDQDAVDTLVRGTTEHEQFYERVRKELDSAAETYRAGLSYTIEQARADYAAQPRIAALRNYDRYRGFLFNGPEDIFDHLDRDEYVQQCRDAAIPGWATLTHDGRWLAPGRMGWFGLSDENPDSQADYLAQVNAYLDSLSADMWLVTVDCHI